MLQRHLDSLVTRRGARSRSASRALGAAILLLAGTAAGCGGKHPEPAPAPEEPAPAPVATRTAPAPVRVPVSIVDSIFILTNRERTRADLTPLRRNADLTRAAQLQAEQMASAEKLAHELPKAKYPSLASRLKLVGYTYRAIGENLAEGYTSGAAVMAGWMTSPLHRANILSARFTETGIGTARSKAGRTYHAQLFGRPR